MFHLGDWGNLKKEENQPILYTPPLNSFFKKNFLNLHILDNHIKVIMIIIIPKATFVHNFQSNFVVFVSLSRSFFLFLEFSIQLLFHFWLTLWLCFRQLCFIFVIVIIVVGNLCGEAPTSTWEKEDILVCVCVCFCLFFFRFGKRRAGKGNFKQQQPVVYFLVFFPPIGNY